MAVEANQSRACFSVLALTIAVDYFEINPFSLVAQIFKDAKVARSMIARHYTDFSPDKLREAYVKSEISVLE